MVKIIFRPDTSESKLSAMAAHVPILDFERLEPKLGPDQKLTDIPNPRSGHRIVVDETGLYSIGGYNPDFWEVENTEDTYYPLFRELWRFSFTRRKWQLLKTIGYMPVELASHSALLDGRHLLVYGGTGVPFGNKASHDLNVCNLETLEWKHIECDGDMPTRSYGHAMFQDGENLFVFGGTTGWQYNSDLYKLRLEDREWEQVCSKGDEPPGRYRHEVAFFKRKLYVFGGGRAQESYKMEKIPVFDFDTCQWSVQNTQPDGQNCFPVARRCHSAVQRDNFIYICGGYNGTEIFGDLWRLNLDMLQWTRLPATLPQPVYFHAAAITPAGYMVIYGGVTEIDHLRTSDVCGIWLSVPPLKELVWQTLLRSLPHLTTTPRAALLRAGIPADLALRIR